ncbi:GGDEF domain-containing protein [Actinoplanes sp. Pm04-4]|uniref:GGDEF domain-containing protein n=1 Tax=Paractinoplanes pyxinae TaxID=2997416 RepID=A0ABT4B4W0_9ACTN|nr:GGDEF domain-containing protein [Actinoplanes pyxinae]MCY1141524.1 GGDEF domain-containing protein [Actinoplanes pyxinae]
MSPILEVIVTACGGVLAGLAAAGPLVWHRQRLLNRWRYLAHRDDTTGLPNRRALLSALERALRTANGPGVGLIVLDLDGFKAINDQYGHQAGNEVLTAVGRRLSALIDPVALAARLSGDEFALLVTGDTNHIAYAASAAWSQVSRDPVAVAGTFRRVHASVGHATAEPGTTAAELLHAADIAMYEAKRTRGGIRAATGIPQGHYGRRYRDRPRH